MFANIWLHCQFDTKILNGLFDHMPAHVIDPSYRSYAISITLLTLAVLAIFEVFLSFIMSISRLILTVLLVCMAGAELLARNTTHIPEPVGDSMEVEDADDWEFDVD
jgi:hypothetical protein